MFNKKEMTGTTIIAIKYDDGVLIGADSRTSMGAYIPSRVTDKLTPITNNIFVCRSGSSADTQMISEYLKMYLTLYSHLESSIPLVQRAATLASKIIYENPSLLAGLIVAGYDDKPRIFNISLGGTLVECDWAIGGSGSAFIYGYCDVNWKNGMSLEEGIGFIKNAVSCAINRDNASGGCIRMSAISRNGVQRYFYPGDKVLQ
ncbi:proteasome subunit beta type-6 [Encephalitozoon intestinalis ATCC 50506]|uniref:Proteasome subunit beta n=1 Tax=Encephalitozoon intestinalis (strain ATCC 50506) TaxID=876142 RepID=E0S9T0_ENCIT|nr:proteasome subunit beta type-6 [Encephalitozoon intestinalis ATCC 50506]ADM12465.1 proteasome subunit beta type-6 [Encephalitozoon intestinalis ATCC 50506]UTX46301.1 proteasome subunit beta type-6 [Encephalitozoon intestinalis]